MSSWVYLFSKFTSEALVFETCFIFLLLTTYTAFWVLKKRKLGSAQNWVPSGVFKNYLNELIQEAHFLRNQLFGILSDSGISLPMTSTSIGAPATIQEPQLLAASAAIATKIAENPELGKKLEELQAKLNEQLKAYQTLAAEKKKLEDDLKNAKTGAASGKAENPGEIKTLKDKIKDLEGKLAEYSVIEDDLANLKRLQQENEQLRAAMGGAPLPTAKAATAAAAPAPATPAATSEATATPSAAVAAPASATTEAAAPESFDNLVDKVEASLQEPAAPAPAAAAEAPPAPAATPEVKPETTAAATPSTDAVTPAPAPAAAASGEKKSDEDLLSEFEKMLNM